MKKMMWFCVALGMVWLLGINIVNAVEYHVVTDGDIVEQYIDEEYYGVLLGGDYSDEDEIAFRVYNQWGKETHVVWIDRDYYKNLYVFAE